MYGQMHLFLLGKYLGMEWLGHMISVCLIFQETAKLLFRGTVSFYIPTSFVREFQLLHILSNVCYGESL